MMIVDSGLLFWRYHVYRKMFNDVH